MRIRQIDCRSLEFFRPIVMKKWGMTMYIDKRKPAVFFGCYSHLAKTEIMNNTSLVVVVWAGGDSLRLHENMAFVEYCLNNTNRVFHIAHSWWIQKDLEKFGIPFIDKVILPRNLEPFQYSENPGANVYHYTTSDKTRQWFYGTDIVKTLRDKWEKPKGYPGFHMTVSSGYSLGELVQLYEDSFIGVRLTEHDNMALSCIELGLMGRPSIFNGNIPGAIHYPSKEYFYDKELKTRPLFRDEELLKFVSDTILSADRKPSKLLAEEMREFVYDDEKWLNTEWYD